MSSHLIAELAKLADDLVVVGAGKLIAAETVDSVTTRTGLSLEDSLLDMTTAAAEDHCPMTTDTTSRMTPGAPPMPPPSTRKPT